MGWLRWELSGTSENKGPYLSGWKWILIMKCSVQENLEAPGDPWPPPRPPLDGDLYTHTRLRACSRRLCENDRENSPAPILPAHGRATGGELSHAGCTLALRMWAPDKEHTGVLSGRSLGLPGFTEISQTVSTRCRNQ